eukprot:4873936-Pyramimonas_sp.AAC.1
MTTVFSSTHALHDDGIHCRSCRTSAGRTVEQRDLPAHARGSWRVVSSGPVLPQPASRCTPVTS